MKNKKIFENILTFDNLYDSALSCSKNVNWKYVTSNYILNNLKETYKLHEELITDTYKEQKQKKFKVYEPKEREVHSIAFRDRVYQRVLTDLSMYPIMSKSFIYDNCACQKQKGTDFARMRLREHMRRFYSRYKTNQGYIIHIDIKKYYPNMPHDIAEKLLKKRLPEDIYTRVLDILRQEKSEKGYHPGSQLIQILGVSFLSEMDHYIKERLHVKYYVRYMDDLVLIVKDNPQFYLQNIILQLQKIKLEVNTKKTKIKKLSKGDLFLGFHFSLGETGKLYMCLSKQNIKRRKRKIQKTIPYQTQKAAEESYNTWRDYASRSTNKAFLKEMDALFRRTLYESNSKK